jgi:hypothetical protein
MKPVDLNLLSAGEEHPLTQDQIKEFISYFESKALKCDQLEIPIVNHFSKGVYAREMRVPKGAFIVGKIHKFKNLNILSSGEVTVLSIDGVMRVKAPFTFVASPGSKRMFFMHEDTVWTTIHGTDEIDVDKIENEFIAKSYEDLIAVDATEACKLEGK